MTLTLTRSRTIAAALTGMATFAVACAPEAPAPGNPTTTTTSTTTVPATPKTVITDDGHLDVLSVDVHGNHMHLGIDHADHAELLDPADTILELGHNNETTIGAQAGFSVLGSAGDELWTLDGGWSVHGAGAGLFTGNSLSIKVLDVQGPGKLGVWRFNGVGEPAFDFLSTNAFPQSLAITHTAHAHRNWSFTEPGDYTVTVEVTGELAAGSQAITTGVETYSFEVGADHEH